MPDGIDSQPLNTSAVDDPFLNHAADDRDIELLSYQYSLNNETANAAVCRDDGGARNPAQLCKPAEGYIHCPDPICSENQAPMLKRPRDDRNVVKQAAFLRWCTVSAASAGWMKYREEKIITKTKRSILITTDYYYIFVDLTPDFLSYFLFLQPSNANRLNWELLADVSLSCISIKLR